MRRRDEDRRHEAGVAEHGHGVVEHAPVGVVESDANEPGSVVRPCVQHPRRLGKADGPVAGAALGVLDLKMIESAAAFVAARMVHLECREGAEQKDEEARLLGQMAEKCLTAHSVEELLPLALEAAMCSLRARRGSILLADACQKVFQASSVLAVTGIIVDAKDEKAIAFYAHFGFVPLQGQTDRMMLPASAFSLNK